MTQADSVLSTPPTNTPIDTTRRRFLAVAAFASVAGAGSLAAVAIAPNDVPQAVTLPKDSGFQADPIYEVIERHRKAAREHTEAVHTHMAFEESNMQGEKLGQYKRLVAATDEAYDELDDVGLDLINTKPTTLAGILALCRYIKPLFAEDDAPDLPEYISYEQRHHSLPGRSVSLCSRPLDRGNDEGGGDGVMSNVVEFPPSDRPVTESDVDKLHSEAFRNLEPGICDCVSMAQIAAQIVTNEAGLSGELVFAVTHAFEMLTALKANHYAAWHGEKQRDAP